MHIPSVCVDVACAESVSKLICACCVVPRLSPGTQFTVDNGKELLRKAIVAYHPDKQQASSSALSKWQVLAEEITKQLTKKYECFK